MKKSLIIILLSISYLITGCASSCMEYLSATTAARSEKDLKRAEEWGLKALKVPSDKTNALVPYFLATEIYKPQEEWEKMAAMLDEALKRNPEQKLEQKDWFLSVPEEELAKMSNNQKIEAVVNTIKKGVQAHRDEAWTIIFNQAIELLNSKEYDVALKKLNLSLKMDNKRAETYKALIGYYVQNDDIKTAKEYVEKGLN